MISGLQISGLHGNCREACSPLNTRAPTPGPPRTAPRAHLRLAITAVAHAPFMTRHDPRAQQRPQGQQIPRDGIPQVMIAEMQLGESADWQGVRALPRIAVNEVRRHRSEEHTSELQSLMRISYAVFCLKKTKTKQNTI